MKHTETAYVRIEIKGKMSLGEAPPGGDSEMAPTAVAPLRTVALGKKVHCEY